MCTSAYHRTTVTHRRLSGGGPRRGARDAHLLDPAATTANRPAVRSACAVSSHERSRASSDSIHRGHGGEVRTIRGAVWMQREPQRFEHCPRPGPRRCSSVPAEDGVGVVVPAEARREVRREELGGGARRASGATSVERLQQLQRRVVLAAVHQRLGDHGRGLQATARLLGGAGKPLRRGPRRPGHEPRARRRGGMPGRRDAGVAAATRRPGRHPSEAAPPRCRRRRRGPHRSDAPAAFRPARASRH